MLITRLAIDFIAQLLVVAVQQEVQATPTNDDDNSFVASALLLYGECDRKEVNIGVSIHKRHRTKRLCSIRRDRPGLSQPAP